MKALLTIFLLAFGLLSTPAQLTTMQYVGVFSSGTTYPLGATAKDSTGALYMSLSANNVGHAPAGSPTYWLPLGAPNSAQVVAALGYLPAQSPVILSSLGTLLADYNLSQGSGTAISDVSGNGNDCTMRTGANAFTWVPNAVSSIADQGASCPAALNAARFFEIAAYVAPITTTPGGPVQSDTYPLFLTSSLGSAGVNLLVSVPGVLGTPAIWSGGAATQCTNYTSGQHTYGYYLGTSSSDPDRIWIDGNECTYLLQGHTAGAQTSGNLYLGSSSAGPWGGSGLVGLLQRVRVYSTFPVPSNAVRLAQIITADIASRGFPTSPQPQVFASSRIEFIGDSIVAGIGVTTPYPTTMLSLLTDQQPGAVDNWGIGGITIQALTWSAPNSSALRCQTTSGGPSSAHVAAGTNDMANSGGTSAAAAATVYANLGGLVQALAAAGCKVFVHTMISRGGTSYGSRTYDADKNAYNALIRNGWRGLGAVGLVDEGAIVDLGADGASSNSSFNSDHVHPNDTGGAELAAASANSRNYFYGASESNPTTVTATSYTMAARDGYVSLAPTAATTLTLPSCIGQSGANYRINNPQSTYAITLKTALSSQPINGTDYSSSGLTVPSSGTLTLRDVPNPPSAAGCHWEK